MQKLSRSRLLLLGVLAVAGLALTALTSCMAADPLDDSIYISAGHNYYIDGVPVGGGGPHAPTHALGGGDDVNITTLAGYSGFATDYLDGSGNWSVPLGATQWVNDATGIHYSLGNVGIGAGGTSEPTVNLYVGSFAGGLGGNTALEVHDNCASAGTIGILATVIGGKTNDTYGIKIENMASSGTAGADKFGLRIRSDGVWTGAGSTNYGLYLEDITGGTNNYSIYSAGGANYFAGTINGLTLASQAVGFTIAGGTISKTLTVTGDATISGTPLSNPMTTLGDIIYEDAVPAPNRLAGNTTTTKKFLTQTGAGGGVSAVPGWNTIVGSDVASSRIIFVGKALGGLVQYTTIQSAINAAAADPTPPSTTAPYTIVILPGIYDEVITMATWVNLKGIGPKGAVVIQRTDSDIVTLATQVQIENLTVRLVTPTAAADRHMFNDNFINCICRFTDVIAEITTPGAGNTIRIFRFSGASTAILERVSFDIPVTTSVITGVQNTAGTSKITINDSYFKIMGPSNSYILSIGALGGIYKIKGTTFDGTCRPLYSINNECSISFDDCTILCTANNMYVEHAIITFRHSTFHPSVIAAADATQIRLLNCFYRTITRSESSNIVDESPYPASYAFHVIKKTWEVALAANTNIATRIAAGGLVTVGGNGQARLRINDNAADAAGVESAADAAGSLASTFTPARTPRYCQQISVSAFRATTTMFFGLRGVLGAAVPGAAEHHAGFKWNGANFIASSSNGGGVGGTTNLATPSTGAQHQLEVIVIGGIKVEFYVDGALVATHTTAAKIPTAALYFQEYEVSTGGGGATTSDITLREGFVQECPN